MINIIENWRQKRLTRKTRQELYGLSDQILSDIGLTRSDIALIGPTGLRHERFGR
ncbi:MAG TPA: DUF1127 domain-containing protein [Devosia sp.]|jgi:uncharacterized protein YjiS (DUF1127 family)|uniref:DUF1127 domain-containing protein n=1 Tax=Devosia sp. TaxID=1871048 RepID=UPI002F95280B